MILVDGAYWLVEDTLTGERRHRYDLRWHLAARRPGLTRSPAARVVAPALTIAILGARSRRPRGRLDLAPRTACATAPVVSAIAVGSARVRHAARAARAGRPRADLQSATATPARRRDRIVLATVTDCPDRVPRRDALLRPRRWPASSRQRLHAGVPVERCERTYVKYRVGESLRVVYRYTRARRTSRTHRRPRGRRRPRSARRCGRSRTTASSRRSRRSSTCSARTLVAWAAEQSATVRVPRRRAATCRLRQGDARRAARPARARRPERASACRASSPPSRVLLARGARRPPRRRACDGRCCELGSRRWPACTPSTVSRRALRAAGRRPARDRRRGDLHRAARTAPGRSPRCSTHLLAARGRRAPAGAAARRREPAQRAAAARRARSRCSISSISRAGPAAADLGQVIAAAAARAGAADRAPARVRRGRAAARPGRAALAHRRLDPRAGRPARGEPLPTRTSSLGAARSRLAVEVARMRPALLFYCQHSVGLGHLMRSYALCDRLAERFRVVLLVRRRAARGHRSAGQRRGRRAAAARRQRRTASASTDPRYSTERAWEVRGAAHPDGAARAPAAGRARRAVPVRAREVRPRARAAPRGGARVGRVHGLQPARHPRLPATRSATTARASSPTPTSTRCWSTATRASPAWRRPSSRRRR